MKDNSGIVGARIERSSSVFGGVWKINEQIDYKKNNFWNTGKIVKGNLLLNLDATNINSYPGSGTTWYDTSGYQLNATGSSAITGQALQANQPYTTATTSILDNNFHSIFFSIQINNSSGTWDKIFGYTPTGTDRSPGIWRYPSSRKIHWRYDPGNTGSFDFTSTGFGAYEAPGTEFVPNTWYYVGVTKNSSTVKAYVNGQLLGTATDAPVTKTAGTSTIQLYPGYTQNSSLMRHVHIYNRVISDLEVLQNYNSIKSSLV
jgi:hypothetical protein